MFRKNAARRNMASPWRLVSRVFFLAFLVASTALHGQDCSPVRFVSTITTSIYTPGSNAAVSGLERKADGSFTRRTYRLYTPYTNTKNAPNYLDDLLRCSKYTNGQQAPSAQAPAIGVGALGRASQIGTVFTLGDPGKRYAVGIDSRFAKDAIVFARSNADGEFTGREDYPVGQNPTTLVVADFNHDDVNDVAVAYYGPYNAAAGGVSILLGNPAGSLGSALNIKLNPNNDSTSSITSVTAFDLDQDGKVDIAASETGRGGVYILRGNGDGSFAQPVFQSMGGGVRQIVAADVQGDGRPDILGVGYVGNTSTLFVLPGVAGGGYAAPLHTTLPVAPASLVTGDLNKDGKLDVVVSSGSFGAAQILLGDGTGKFSVGPAYQTVESGRNMHITDLNLDGNPDIVVGGGDPAAITPNENSGEIAVLFGKGDGSFYGTPSFPTRGSVATDLTTADLNGDGKLDVLAARGGLNVLLANADGSYRSVANVVPPQDDTVRAVGALAVGRISGDSTLDVVASLSRNSQIVFYSGNGDGTFRSGVSFNACEDGGDIELVDLNTDGSLDVVVACLGSSNAPETSRLGILLGNGGGSFSAPTVLNVGSGVYAVHAADFNGDGKPDLAVGRDYYDTRTGGKLGGLTILLGKGNGTFENQVDLQPTQSVNGISSGDLNEDGKVDLVVSGSGVGFSDQIAVLLGDGAGSFRQEVWKAEFGPRKPLLADYSRDGKLDMLVPHCCGDDLGFAIYLGNGDGSFQSAGHMTTGASPYTAAVADLNADGAPDIVAGLSGSETSSIGILINAVDTGTPLLSSVSAASFRAGKVAPVSLVTGFGAHLATETAYASSLPLPTMLGGSTVTITDSSGASFAAELLYVGPTQVNYVIPRSVANGLASVRVNSSDGVVTAGFLQVANIAPALFLFDQTSKLVAGAVVRVRADGSQSEEAIFQLGGSGEVLAKPVSMGDASETVYLVLYGTGIRGHVGNGYITAKVGGETAAVEYAGPQGSFVGLDQVNLKLPRSLAGKGKVNVELTFDYSVPAPVATLEIQ